MTLESRLDALARGWRGPLIAAVIAFVAGLPGLMAMPPLDRDESRFAQATSQMLETGDYVAINFQDQPRDKKPVGIHWMQAVSVALFSHVEDRDIWPYRIPSLLGAMLAAAACAWGARVWFGERAGLMAGAMFGASFLLSTEAFIAKTDAVLAGCVTLAMAALGRIYAASLGVGEAGWRTSLLLWLGIAFGILVKGPVIAMVVLLTLAALWAWDRDARWMKHIGWGWGLVLVLAVCGPWALAITVASDGGFWGAAIGGDLAPKLVGGHERHGGPFGYHLLISPLTLFPFCVLLPAALISGWKHRAEPGVRFALCWLIPTWLAFEILPTKLFHYSLPTHAALFWLMAAALREPLTRWGRYAGAAVLALGAGVLSVAAAMLMVRYGDPSDLTWAAITTGLFALSGVTAIILILRRAAASGVIVAGALAVLAHAAFFGQFGPRLEPFWPAPRIAMALERTGLAPKDGRTPGPVEVDGYSEASMVFTLGTRTGVGGPEDAVRALAEGRPAIVEKKEEKAFLALMKARGVPVDPVTRLKALNYSTGKDLDLTFYRGVPRSTNLVSQPAAATPASRAPLKRGPEKQDDMP
ncbi:MAG: glycosyltransferase family 39 protein [Caulobacter sp.]|nr:glycosyltransferase family 39 protein [Caulobacter sp.]